MSTSRPQSEKRSVARGSLLGIEDLPVSEINKLLLLARKMNPAKARPLLRGKRVLLLFYEASTRTRTSFEVAAQALGAETSLVISSGSSIEKGESLLDTAYTLRAVGADAIDGSRDDVAGPRETAESRDAGFVDGHDRNVVRHW